MKKFNFKLAIFLAGLFISLTLLFVGSKNKICLGIGFMFLGITLGFYAYYKTAEVNEMIKLSSQDLDEIDEEDKQTYKEYKAFHKHLIKQRNSTMITFSLCAFLLVVVGIFYLI